MTNTSFIQSYKPISVDKIPLICPNAAMANKGKLRSNAYTHVDTMGLVRFFVAAGLIPVYAAQTQKRVEQYSFNPFEEIGETQDADNENDGWHKISLMRSQDAYQLTQRLSSKGSIFPMVSIINSHDGTHRLSLSSGMLRQICNNGLSVTNPTNSFVARHTEDLSDLLDEAQRILTGSEETIEYINKGKGKVLDLESNEYRWLDNNMVIAKYEKPDYKLSNLLYLPSHSEEEGSKVSAWSFYNDRQEALTRGYGNMIGYGTDKHGNSFEKVVKIRGIKSPKTNHVIQEKFWGVYKNAVDTLA